MDTQNRSDIFSDYSLNQSVTHTASKSFMSNVFMFMFAGLALSGLFACLFAATPALMEYLRNAETGKLTTLGLITMFSPLGFVMLISFGFNRLPVLALIPLFLAYSAINGIAFSFILLQYTGTSVLGAFVSSAVMFGVMAIMGYTTNKDLTGFGRILSMGLIGLIVALLISYFVPGMNMIVSLFGVAIFTGLTAYDMQTLKRIGQGLEYGDVAPTDGKKLAILGALNLYLDFVNIFLFMLRLFGNRR